MYSPRLVKEVLKALGKQLVDDGRLDSVSLHVAGPTADFPELGAQKPIKVKKGKIEDIDRVLKQKLFDYVSQSECAERQDRLSSLKWVLKNKGEEVRARLVVRERSRKPNLKTRSSNTSDLFSAMPPVESLKALVSHVMTERVDRRGRNLVLAVFDVSRAHIHGVCVNAMVAWSRTQSYIVLDS